MKLPVGVGLDVPQHPRGREHVDAARRRCRRRRRTPSPGSSSRTRGGSGTRPRGARRGSASMSSGRMPAWTWHSPSQTWKRARRSGSSRRPVSRSTKAPEPHVGAEEDLGLGAVLGPDVLDDLDRVGGGAAVVGLRLHLGRGVDVHDDDARPGARPSRRAAGRRRSSRPASSRRRGRGSARSSRGERIEAVSAMKWTPQKAITSASVAAAWRERPRQSPMWSATSWTSGSW